MRRFVVALGAAAAFAVGGAVAAPGRLGYYLNTTTTTVFGGDCGTSTSTIYVTLPVAETPNYATADVGTPPTSAVLSTTQTTETNYVTMTVSSLSVTTTLQSTATSTVSVTSDSVVYVTNPVETTVGVSEVNSDESTTTSTVTGTSTSIVATVTATSTVTGPEAGTETSIETSIETDTETSTSTTTTTTTTATVTVSPSASSTIYVTLPTSTVTTLTTITDIITAAASTTGLGSSFPAGQGPSPITASYVVTEYITTSQSPSVESASLTTYTTTEYLTSIPAPSVQSAECTTYVSTEYFTTAYVYTYSRPTPSVETPTGSVVVVTSEVTVVPQISGAQVPTSSSSPILETRTLTISNLYTVTETLVPETTITLPPVTLTNVYNVTETAIPATTLSAVPLILTSLETILSSPSSLTAMASSLAINSSSVGTSTLTNQSILSTAASTAEVSMTVSTVYSTTTYTVSKCAASVTSCPYGSVTTETISQYVTTCPVANATSSSSGVGATSSYQSSNNSIGWNMSSYGSSTVYSNGVSLVSTTSYGLNMYGPSTIPARTSALSASAGFLKSYPSIEPSPFVQNSVNSTPAATGSAFNGTTTAGQLQSSPSTLIYGPTPIPTPISSGFNSSISQINSTQTTLMYGPTPISTSFSSILNSTISISQAAINFSTTTIPSSSVTPAASSSFGPYTMGSLTSTANSSSTLMASSLITSAAQSSSLAAATQSPTSMPREFTSPSFTSSGTAIPTLFATPTTSTSTGLNGTTATSSGALTSSTCGEHGDFTLNFDDVAPLSASNNATVDAEPVFSPYHQFYFSQGFVVVPPPTDPYVPSSGTRLLEFVATNSSSVPANPVPEGVNLGTTGGIGSGYTEQLGCFNFNAYGASLGCDSQGPPCIFQVTGMKYNPTTKVDEVATSQTIPVSACPTLKNCDLVPVDFDSNFVNLTSVYINATVADVPKIWFADDLRLGWTDNSCDAGLCRQSNI